MPRYQQLISCTFHIDNLVAVFKAKLGRAQGNRVNGLGSVRATEFRTTRLYRTPIMGACGCALDQNFASCESQTPGRVTTSRLDSAFVPSPDSPEVERNQLRSCV